MWLSYYAIVCTSERDKVWNITWSTTLLGATDYQYCPGSTNGNFSFFVKYYFLLFSFICVFFTPFFPSSYSETAKRKCFSSGMWGRPEMSNCSGTSWFFSTLLSNVRHQYYIQIIMQMICLYNNHVAIPFHVTQFWYYFRQTWSFIPMQH